MVVDAHQISCFVLCLKTSECPFFAAVLDSDFTRLRSPMNCFVGRLEFSLCYFRQ